MLEDWTTALAAELGVDLEVDVGLLLDVARDALAAALDRLGKGKAIGQAGEAVAQHFRTEVVLGADLDRQP